MQEGGDMTRRDFYEGVVASTNCSRLSKSFCESCDTQKWN